MGLAENPVTFKFANTLMAEESRTNSDDSQGIELSESELKELQRLEAKKQASQKKVLDSKDNLFGAVLADLDLEGLDLHDAKMAKANLSNTNLSGANLSNANFIEADLTEANLSKADLHDAYFADAHLVAADLSEADLRWADFSWAVLSEVRFNEANLLEADFTETTLVAADFTMANVTGANFDHANLIDVRLKGVDLSQALNLTPKQIESAEIDKATQLPPYLEITWEGPDDFKVQKAIQKKTKRKKSKK